MILRVYKNIVGLAGDISHAAQNESFDLVVNTIEGVYLALVLMIS